MDARPDNVYFSWTGCVPQNPWEPSAAFLTFLHTDLCRDEFWTKAHQKGGDHWRSKATDKAKVKKAKPKTKRKKTTRAKVDYSRGELYFLNLMSETVK